MTFTRTPAGIGNQAIFLGKRFIVYVEEDPDLDPSRSVDIGFWGAFFRRAFGSSIFEFRGLGGKNHVVQMARTIIDNSVPNALCALDKDYDDLFGDQIVDERVFYTFGYGVENDLLNERTVPRVVSSIVPGRSDGVRLGKAAWRLVTLTSEKEAVLLRSDQVAACRSRATLDRRTPLAAIDLSRSTLPLRFRRSAVGKLIAELRGLPVTRIAAGPISVSWCNCPAHLHGEIVYHTVYRYMAAITSFKYRKEWVRNVASVLLNGDFWRFVSSFARQHYRALAARDIAKFSTL